MTGWTTRADIRVGCCCVVNLLKATGFDFLAGENEETEKPGNSCLACYLNWQPIIPGASRQSATLVLNETQQPKTTWVAGSAHCGTLYPLPPLCSFTAAVTFANSTGINTKALSI